MKNSKSFRAKLFLVLAAFIWGTAFVAQREGAQSGIGAFTFVFVRSVLAVITLIPIILVMDKIKGKKISLFGSEDKKEIKTMLLGGVICGAVLAAATLLQQSGMSYTDAGKAGFITSMYIVFVPIFALFFGKKTGINVWFSVVLAVLGLYFMSVKEGFILEEGDLLITISTLFYAVQILIIDYFANRVDTVRFSVVQFATVALISGVLMLIFEQPKIENILQSWLPLLYVGVLSGGVAFTLQIIAQKDIAPQVASIIMCLEAVFALLGGIAVFGETLNQRETIGCVIMFAAVILSQISFKKKEERGAA